MIIDLLVSMLLLVAVWVLVNAMVTIENKTPTLHDVVHIIPDKLKKIKR